MMVECRSCKRQRKGSRYFPRVACTMLAVWTSLCFSPVVLLARGEWFGLFLLFLLPIGLVTGVLFVAVLLSSKLLTYLDALGRRCPGCGTRGRWGWPRLETEDLQI